MTHDATADDGASALQRAAGELLLSLGDVDALPPGMTCIPFIVSDQRPPPDPQSRYGQDRDGRWVVVGPPQQSHLLEVAAHVFPDQLLDGAHAFGLVVSLQLASVEIGDVTSAPGLDPRDTPRGGPHSAAHLVDLATARELGTANGSGALGCWYQRKAPGPGDDAAFAVRALDGTDRIGLPDHHQIAWSATTPLAPLCHRLAGRTPDLDTAAFTGMGHLLPPSQVFALGWAVRVARAAERHGPGSDRTLDVLSKPPTDHIMQRATGEKLVAAAADGRIPTDLSPEAVRWAGPDLVTIHLMGEHGTFDRVLQRIAASDEELAGRVGDVLRDQLQLDV